MMTGRREPTLLDVTLRDGSYAIQYQFTPSHVGEIVKALFEAGISFMELGHGCGLGARDNMGIDAAAGDLEYVQAAREAAPGARIGVIAGASPLTRTKNIDAVIEYLDFIRFAANCNNIGVLEANILHARRRKRGIRIFVQMMRSTRLSPKALLASARQAAALGAHAVYLVDTAGHYLPDEVREIIGLFASELPIGVGFHGHNNLCCAVANTVAAMEAGAHYIDASLKGLGRGAGNAMLEAVVSLMKRKGMAAHVDLDRLIEAGETLIAPLMPPRKGVDALDIITADANIDLYPPETYRAIAGSQGLDFTPFIRMLASDPELVEATPADMNRVLASHPGKPRPSPPPLPPGAERFFMGRDDEAPELSVMIALKGASGPGDCPAALVEGLASLFPRVAFYFAPYHPEKIACLEEAEVFFSFSLTPSLLQLAPKLRWYHSLPTGAQYFYIPGPGERDITITTPRGAYAPVIAESILSYMLALTRKLKQCFTLQEKRVWGTAAIHHSDVPAGELAGAVVTVVGLGGIGSETARRCKALGMTVQAVVPTARENPGFVDRMALPSGLDDLLKVTDFLVLSCPLTGDTWHLVNRERIASMKPGACLVNVSSGAVLDEAALLDALRSGHLAGAALDVLTVEPLPSCHPFYTMPSVILTPHVSGWSRGYWERAFGRFRENLSCFLKGEPMVGVFDPQRGY